MVKRFLTLLHQKYGGLHEAAILLALSSFFSQVLGLVRDRALVGALGAGQVLDIYYTSFKIPDLIYALLASLVSVTVLVPYLQKKIGLKERQSEEYTLQIYGFLNSLIFVFGVVLVLVIIVVGVSMPWLLHVFLGDRFTPELFRELVTMSRILLLSPLFFGIQNILASITQYHKKFFVLAISPVVYNIGILIGIWFLYPILGPVGLVLGVVLGAFSHMVIQIPVLYGVGFSFSTPRIFDWSGMYTICKTSLPRTITLALSAVVLFILTLFLNDLSTGSVSLFNFALNVQSIPLMVIGLSYAVASFPMLVEARALSQEQFKNVAESIGNAIIFWSLPCMTLFVILRAHIIRVIYGSQNFSWGDTRTTAALFALITIGVIFQSLILLFVRMFYASGYTKQPFLFSTIGAISTIVLSYFGVYAYEKLPFHLELSSFIFRFSTENTRPELLVVGVGYIFGYFVTAILLAWGLKKYLDLNPFIIYRRVFFHTTLGSLVIGSITYFVLQITSGIFPLTSFINVLFHGLIAGFFGILGGAVVFSLLKTPEFGLVLNALKHKFWKKTTIAPNESDI